MTEAHSKHHIKSKFWQFEGHSVQMVNLKHNCRHIGQTLQTDMSVGRKQSSVAAHRFHELIQNNYQQDGTFGLSFISGLFVLHSTCFELQGVHHQEFHFLLYRQSLAYCVIFFCIAPVPLRVLFPTVCVFGTIVMMHGTMNLKKNPWIEFVILTLRSL